MVLTAVAGKARGRVEVAGVVGELAVARPEEEGLPRDEGAPSSCAWAWTTERTAAVLLGPSA